MIVNGHPDMLQVGCVSHAGHMRRTCNKPTLAPPLVSEDIVISRTATSIGVQEIILLARWFSHQYIAISRTATSIGVREIIPLAHWFSHQYAAISHTATSIDVREIILLAHWFSHQYVAISRTLTSDGQGTTTAA